VSDVAAPAAHPWRRAAALAAAALVVLGLLATVIRLDTPADPGMPRLGWSTWRADGVVVDVPPGSNSSELKSGEVVTAIAGHRLTERPGGVLQPTVGQSLEYEVNGAVRQVAMERPSPAVMIRNGWGEFDLRTGVGRSRSGALLASSGRAGNRCPGSCCRRTCCWM
jgi:hypothetical protein